MLPKKGSAIGDSFTGDDDSGVDEFQKKGRPLATASQATTTAVLMSESVRFGLIQM
jgi:hypothetical protein